MGNVDDEIAGVAILLADAEHHTAGHPALHQDEIAEPDLSVAHPGMDFPANDRKDHRVVLRFDVLFQQRQVGCRPHCGFLAVDELLAQVCLRPRIGWLEKPVHAGLILRSDIQRSAQRQELPDRHAQRSILERTGGRRFDDKP
ncbi:hypothetical protein D3C87_1002520 [compost metagenome]